MNHVTDYEKIFQLDLVLLLVSDNEGRIVKVNKAWESVLGYTEKELLGRSFLEFIHPEDLEATGEQLKMLGQLRGVNRFINRYRCKDGSYKTLEWNAQPDRDLNYGIARDITEMIKANEEIRKQRERFALAVEGSSDGIWDLDLITGEHYLSPRWKELLGYEDTELKNETITFEQLLHPEDRGVTLRAMEEFLATGDTIWDREFRLRHKDGSYRWIHARGKAFSDNQGRVYRVAGSHTDITQMKQSAEALRLSEEKYRLIAENVVDTVWVYDLTQQHFCYISPGVEQLLGYSVQEAMNLTIHDLLVPAALSEAEQAMQEAVLRFLEHPETPVQYTRDLQHRRKDGTVVWVEQITKYRFSDSGTIEVVGVSHNIDVRKKTSEALRMSEERYRKILNQAPFPIFIVRVSDGTMRYGNERAKRQFGFSNQEGIGLPASQFYQDQQERRKFLQKLKEQGMFYDHEIEMLNWHGEPYTALVSASFIEYEEELAILVSINDITDRKKAEEEIRYLSYHDSLTGLYNRHFYEEMIEKPISADRLPITLIVADVNGLKLANDAFGHSFGDRLLIRFAEVLKRNQGPMDVAARIGGDEFVLLVPNVGEQEANLIVKKIERDCDGEFVDSIALSASLGFYVNTDGSVLPQDAYKQAEDAMYRQKMVVGSSYRNHVVNGIIENVFLRNPDDRVHSEELAQICRILGTALSMSETELSDLTLAARLHDIGKIGVDASLTDLDETLDDQPNDEFKKHSPVGYHILHSASDYAQIAESVLAHHERADGSGYPKGLFLDQIPLQARIIRLANDLDLMQRKYGWSKERIMTHLKENSGKIYDPELVQVLISAIF